jgi:hypothetical protein
MLSSPGQHGAEQRNELLNANQTNSFEIGRVPGVRRAGDGGRDFGPFPAPNSPLHIFSRNLTPDSTGKPEGGHSLAEFIQTMRTGKDFDTSVHPTCPAGTPQTASCVPYPFDGGLLQIMRWPAFHDMTNRQLQAIYEYLSAIPCIDSVVAGQPQLRNSCPAP